VVRVDGRVGVPAGFVSFPGAEYGYRACDNRCGYHRVLEVVGRVGIGLSGWGYGGLCVMGMQWEM
jgi:hypothetical protein